MERSKIEVALRGASFQRELHVDYIEEVKDQQAKSFALFYADSRSDADDEQKRKALEEWNASTAYLRTVGDLLVAAFFNGKKPKDREQLKQSYLEATLQHRTAEALEDALSETLERLREGDKGLHPLHWQLTFPDVFSRPEPGFDVFVGNPPFAGNKTISSSYKPGIIEYLKEAHVESGGQCDLSAYFFRRCFSMNTPGGCLGFISTNTISQGDTRSSGLRWICNNGGSIYSATRKRSWPGIASVIVSVVHIVKGDYPGKRLLDSREVKLISAFLFSSGGNDDPMELRENEQRCFQGSQTYGMGFTFSDAEDSDNETPGSPMPIQTMKILIEANKKSEEVIYPYIGGEEVNTSPSQIHRRFVVDFRDRSEEECMTNWPEIFTLLEKKVRPKRQEMTSSGEFKLRKPLPQRWWQHGEKRPGLYRTIRGLNSVLATNAQASPQFSVALLDSGSVFANSLNIFAFESLAEFGLLQSSIHEIFARNMSSSMGESLRYNPSDCFLTFPFPTSLRRMSSGLRAAEGLPTSDLLEIKSREYYELRAHECTVRNEGLTAFYNRFDSPLENDEGINNSRHLHCEVNTLVAQDYGWRDIDVNCGFDLSSLDLSDCDSIPSEQRISLLLNDHFFWTAEEADVFHSTLISYGIPERLIKWKYTMPSHIRDEIFARLVSLNAERHAEELVQGLHSKGKKAAATAIGKKRSRSAKTAVSESSEQMGLGL